MVERRLRFERSRNREITERYWGSMLSIIRAEKVAGDQALTRFARQICEQMNHDANVRGRIRERFCTQEANAVWGAVLEGPGVARTGSCRGTNGATKPLQWLGLLLLETASSTNLLRGMEAAGDDRRPETAACPAGIGRDDPYFLIGQSHPALAGRCDPAFSVA